MRVSADSNQLEVPTRSELLSLLPEAARQKAVSLIAESLPIRSQRYRLRELVCGAAPSTPEEHANIRVQLAQYLASLPKIDAKCLQLIRQGADAAHDLLLPEVSQQLWQKLLDQAVKSAQPESTLLEPLVELGVACALDEKYQMARRRWRQAVEFCPIEHPELTELLLAIAESDVNDNRFDRAESRLMRVAENCQSAAPSDHLSLLQAQWEFLKGGVAIGLGRNAEARDRFQRSVELRTPLLSPTIRC